MGSTPFGGLRKLLFWVFRLGSASSLFEIYSRLEVYFFSHFLLLRFTPPQSDHFTINGALALGLALISSIATQY